MASSMDENIQNQNISSATLIRSLTILTSPALSKSSLLDGSSEQLLDNVLQSNLQQFVHHLSSASDLQDKLEGSGFLLLQHNLHKSFLDGNNLTIRQKFTEVCIAVLDCLKNALSELSSNSVEPLSTRLNSGEQTPSLCPDALSIQQEKVISTAVQFVLVLGLYPYLAPGVGIPVSQRLGPGQILLATAQDYSQEFSDLERLQFILPVTKLLCSMLEVPSLKDIVLNNYLADLLTSLIQLRYSSRIILNKLESQNKDKNSNAEAIEIKTKDSNVDVSKHNSNNELILFPSDKVLKIHLDSTNKPWTLHSVIEYGNINIDSVIRLTSTPQALKVIMLLSCPGKHGSSSVKSAPWFRKTVACILRDIIMAPSGVQHLIGLFIEEGAESGKSSQDWQRCRALAQVISRCPLTASNTEKFYRSVCQQLIDHLKTPLLKIKPLVVRAIGVTLLEMTNQQAEIMQTVCWSNLLSPLQKLTYSNDKLNSQHQIVVAEDCLSSCIETLHKVYVLGQEPQSTLPSTLSPIFGVLFSLHVFARNGVSSLKSYISELLKVYLTHCDTQTGVSYLLTVVTNLPDQTSPFPLLRSKVKFEYGVNGGIQAVLAESTMSDLNMDSWLQPGEAALSLLLEMNSELLIPQLFMSLLEKLTNIITTEVEHHDVLLPTRVLTSAEHSDKIRELKEKITLVSFLAALGEKFGEEVIQSSQHVLRFTKATLERCVHVCQCTSESSTKYFEWETVSMALGLLTAVLGGAVQLTEEDKQLLDGLLPLLSAVGESEATDPSVKEMAEDLKVAVATRGLVWAELSKPKTKPSAVDKNNKPGETTTKKPLIELLAETSFEDGHDCHTKPDRPNESYTHGKTPDSIESALQDLCDPLLPVRSHGLITLAKLVENRNPEVIEKQQVLLKIFLENLTHTDSYMYLAAVNGLSALGDLNPHQVLTRLTAEFRTLCSRGAKSEEMTLKVGEALMKATRRLGELTPVYRDLLLTATLVGCRHRDALVRASSLSNLAELCKLLRFSIGPIIHEVLSCCRDVIQSDPDSEPRKAAAMTLTLLLQGLGKDSLLTLSDVLLDLYRILKRCFTCDADDKVRFHAHLALNELDTIMREALFTAPELKKTITILGYQ
ncbi:transport and Golgi organization protein 6 homolog [Physella acuta]|uniref:transport and Golgi organization protein 6 homolog n=1 Tax=Physella acuta TaxID=109671 RepID=UPI0027DE3EF6|nr:transport and Golgi organization protein 6 homolog [Physella acuta]